MREMNCTRAGETDLVALYLAGKLSESEAEGFEAHYLGCETCASTLRLAGEIRAALGKPVLVPAARPSRTPGLGAGHLDASRRRGDRRHALLRSPPARGAPGDGAGFRRPSRWRARFRPTDDHRRPGRAGSPRLADPSKCSQLSTRDRSI